MIPSKTVNKWFDVHANLLTIIDIDYEERTEWYVIMVLIREALHAHRRRIQHL